MVKFRVNHAELLCSDHQLFLGLTLYITEITASTISTNCGNIYIYVHIYLYIKCLLFMSNLLQIRISSNISVEIQMPVPCRLKKEEKEAGETDRQSDMMRATVTFCI